MSIKSWWFIRCKFAFVHSLHNSISYKFYTFGRLKVDTYLLSLSSWHFLLQTNAKLHFFLSFAFFSDRGLKRFLRKQIFLNKFLKNRYILSAFSFIYEKLHINAKTEKTITQSWPLFGITTFPKAAIKWCVLIEVFLTV